MGAGKVTVVARRREWKEQRLGGGKYNLQTSCGIRLWAGGIRENALKSIVTDQTPPHP